MRLRYFFVTVLIALLSTAVMSASYSETSALTFTSIQLDARTIGLGGASSLIPGPGTAHLGNPALLSAYNKISFGGSYVSYIADIDIGAWTGSYRFKNGIMISPTFRYFSIGSIEGYDLKGDKLDTDVAPFSLDGGIAVGYTFLEVLSTGLQMRVAYEYLSPEIIGVVEESVSATAMVFDGGIYYSPSRVISLSAGFRNSGFFLKNFEDDDSKLPASLYTGVRYQSRGATSVNLLLEAEKEYLLPLRFKPGMEFLLHRQIIALRFGTNFSTDDVSQFFSVLAGDNGEKFEYSKSEPLLVSLGAGVKVPVNDKTIFFDFSSQILGDDMGLVLYFSGGFSF